MPMLVPHRPLYRCVLLPVVSTGIRQPRTSELRIRVLIMTDASPAQRGQKPSDAWRAVERPDLRMNCLPEFIELADDRTEVADEPSPGFLIA